MLVLLKKGNKTENRSNLFFGFWQNFANGAPILEFRIMNVKFVTKLTQLEHNGVKSFRKKMPCTFFRYKCVLWWYKCFGMDLNFLDMGQFQNSVVKYFWSFLNYLDQTKMFWTWIFTRYFHILRVKMKNNSVSETSSSHFAQLAHFLEPHFFFEKPSKINVKVIDIVWT